MRSINLWQKYIFVVAWLGIFGGGQSALANDAINVNEALKNTTLTIASVGWKEEEAALKLAGLDKTPYTINFQTFQGGGLALEGVAANKVDVTNTSEIPPVFASLAANNGNFKIIATERWTTLHQELIVPPDSKIKTVADLKGKRVGYIKSTTAHYFLHQMLKNAGLGWNDIQRVEITTADGVTALFSGGIDAFASYGNSVTSAKQRGAHTLASAQDILSGNYPVIAAETALQDRGKRAAIADYIGRINTAKHYAELHPEAWAKVSADPTGRSYNAALADIKAEYAQRPTSYEILSPEAIASQQNVSDVLFATGLLQAPVKVAGFFDNSLSGAIEQAKQRYITH
ncbi:ABC transporter substrate-binding protein [Phytobacter sp. V91]|uniref:ABC transporter substrate-binding protein n=1 Tax=Phytobacter sp. V91 TaxID=3369425 RepID=UPI003F5D8D11